MQAWFWRQAKFALGEGVAAAASSDCSNRDCRAMLCNFEDDLFARHPGGHRIMGVDETRALIATVFIACGRTVPRLELVAGFADPKVGGYADIEGNRIMIEEGCLYRFLVLHEAAHILVPADHRHGSAFIYVLQMLYRVFVGVPEQAVRDLLLRHGLPSYTDLPRERRLFAA
jgi:hypothetical protein